MYDVAIIGAGVVGGLIARELSKYRLKICILEKEGDVAMGASKANSALVHAGYDPKPGTLKALLNVRGSEMFEELCAELGVGYKHIGALVVGTEDEMDILHELLERGRTNGVRGLRIVCGEELREMEPMLSDNISCALYAPTSAITCPYELTVAAVGNAMDNGVELRRDFKVTGIRPCDGGYELISPAGRIAAKYYINSAGLHAGEVCTYTGGEDLQRTVRSGEYMLLDRECAGFVRHTIFPTPTKHGKGILVTPTVHGNLLLGPTSIEREDKDDTSVTPEGINEILEKTRKTVKDIPYWKVITSFAGLRSVDEDFIIKPGERCIHLMRIGSPGLSAAPAIAVYVKDMLAEFGLELVPKDNFNPYRKPCHGLSEMSPDDRNKLIKQNSKYGRIICRCEGISEGEIVDAIRMNPGARDLDGVKRRTRAGMGRCQGGFCSPAVLEILARELGIKPEEVTKSGGGSYILVGKTKEER